MTGARSLVVTGALELQLDALAERVATRVVELLTAGAAYEREPDPGHGGTDLAARGRHQPTDIGLDDGLPGAGS